MEPLVLIPKEQWPKLLDFFKGDGANHIAAASTLRMQIIYPALSEEYNLKVYCPNGELSNGMIATAYNADQDSYRVMVHPLQDSKKVEHALRTTGVIDWKKSIMVPGAIPEVVQWFKRLETAKGIKLLCNDSSKAIMLVLKHTDLKHEPLCCPPNTYVGALKPEHIKLVDETWTYQGDYTYKYFESLVTHGLTYVLYSNDDRPLAWVSVSESGYLSHLYCVEEYRRHGYAKFIAKYASNETLAKGFDVAAYVLVNNLPAFKLLETLGFEIVGDTYWLFMYPNRK